MRSKYLITIYLIFLISVLLIMPRLFPISQVQSATNVQGINQYIRFGELFFFAWAITFASLYALSHLSLYFSSRPDRPFFFPFFANKYPRGKSTVYGILAIGKKPLSFGKILIFDEVENEIGYFFTDESGTFKIKLRAGNYIFQGEGFGFEGKATKPVAIKDSESLKIELNCFSKEDLFFNPQSRHLISGEKYALALASIFSPFLGWFSFSYQSSILGMLVVLAGVVLFIIFALSTNEKLIIRDRKGQRIVNKEIEISDSTGTKKHKVEPDIFGNLIVLFSPGIYKISCKGMLPRNIRVNRRTVASASIKLG